MRVRSLKVLNLLSFDDLEVDQIDPSLTTIVGPNGSGKTNLVRLFTLVATALDWVEDRRYQMVPDPRSPQGVLSPYVAARYRGAAVGQPLRVELGIELTGADEREQLACFVQSAIISTLLSWSGRRQQDGPVVAEWAVEQVTPESLAPLMCGTLVVEHPGVAHAPWQVVYQFCHGDTAYRWMLAGRSGRHGIVAIDDNSVGGPAQFPTVDLLQVLFGIASTGTPTPELPSPLPEFSFEGLCPEPGKVVELLVQGGGGHFDLDLEPHRRLGEIVGLGPSGALLNQALSLASVLRQIVRRGIVVVGEQLRGADLEGRSLPTGRYSIGEISRSDTNWAPSALPLRLFQLKNGDGSERQRFDRIRRMFENLAPGRRLDVRFEAVGSSREYPQPPPSSPAGSEQPPTQPGGEFSITIVIGEGLEDDSWELPVTLTGAGVWEALVLAEAVADSDDRVVVLDEPALNLHPTWQRFLAAYVRNAPGQFLVITHSPYLVPIEGPGDLAGLLRLSRSNGATVRRRYSDGVARDMDLQRRIIQEFSLSSDARALLFAAGAVLVEGGTELGALPLWFEQSGTAQTLGTPGRLHLGFFSVGGEDHFLPVLALLVALGIPWVIICDGGAFRVDKGGKHIFRQVLKAGAGDGALRAFVGERLGNGRTDLTFEKVVAVGRDHGVFTLASGWTRAVKNGIAGDESFEAFAESVAPGKLSEAEREVGSSKVRVGRWLAEKVPCPEKVDDLYRRILNTLKLDGAPISRQSPSPPDGTVAR